MKASYPRVVLAWLVGVGIGATGIGALHAQSHTSPGYFVAGEPPGAWPRP